MEESNVSSVNAEPVVNVEPQIETNTEPVSETTQSVSEEVAAPQVEQKPVQDAQTNAMYAKIRREAEQRAQDKVIAEMGYTWNNKQIKTYAEYQQALQEQKMYEEAQQKGIDPEFYTRFNSVEQELNSYKRNASLLQQETELSADPVKGELFTAWKDDVKQLANEFNVDYRTAFSVVLEQKLPEILGRTKAKVEQETIKKLNTNASSTPGALGNSEHVPQKSIWDMSTEEFSKMQERALRGELRNY